MAVRHAKRIADLGRAIIEARGAISADQRRSAAAGEATGTGADAYLEKVRRASYRITDEDVAALRRAGLAEDAIFELTLAAAFGEAERRFDGAVASLSRASSKGSR